MSFNADLTARMQAALDAGAPYYLFADIDHPDGMVRLWTGIGLIEWDGETYIGRGRLGTLSQVETSSVLQIADRTLRLSGLDPTQGDFLSADVRGRVAEFAIGCVVKGKVVRDPYLVDRVLMDAQKLPVDENGMVAVEISGFSGLWTLQRAQNLAWSAEQSKVDDPDETGFDFIPSLVNKDTKWKALPPEE